MKMSLAFLLICGLRQWFLFIRRAVYRFRAQFSEEILSSQCERQFMRAGRQLLHNCLRYGESKACAGLTASLLSNSGGLSTH